MIIAEVDLGGARGFQARVRDVSDGGLRIATRIPLMVGTRLRLQLPRIGWVEARVAWRKEGLFGLTFCREIDSRWAFAGVPGAFMAA